ncbi:MAG: MinD/ParA family protein, partial [Planctomycetes bacterium]|nr:MinD/ParA family protein [Planctomycetota bacterium]
GRAPGGVGDAAMSVRERDITASIGLDQAAGLRRLVKATRGVRRPQGRARVLAVTSGKGGVGKSSFALNFAIAAGRYYQRVVLVDVDLGLANLDVMCGVKATAGLADVISGRKRLFEVAVPIAGRPSGRDTRRVDLIPGASGVAYLADLPDEDRARLLAQLEIIERQADLVILDTGAGVSRNVIRIAAAADEVFVVTTPEPTSITDAYAVVKLVSREREHGTLRLVVNQASSRGEASKVAARIASVARRFLSVTVEPAGSILTDRKAGEAVRLRRALVTAFPASPAALDISTIARRLRGTAKTSAKTGFVGRLKRAFRVLATGRPEAQIEASGTGLQAERQGR